MRIEWKMSFLFCAETNAEALHSRSLSAEMLMKIKIFFASHDATQRKSASIILPCSSDGGGICVKEKFTSTCLLKAMNN